MTNNQVQKVLGQEISKSKKMIELYLGGLEIKTISELMGTRYNFVYNVVSNHCNMNGLKINTNKKDGDSKKELIIKMFQEGKSNKEISIDLKTNYNYVFNTIKSYKQSITPEVQEG